MISALIISFYDHNYIEECIASLSFVDEIIVIGKIDPVVLSGIEHQNLVQFIESENLNFDFLLEKTFSSTLYQEIREVIRLAWRFWGVFARFRGDHAYLGLCCNLEVWKNIVSAVGWRNPRENRTKNTQVIHEFIHDREVIGT